MDDGPTDLAGGPLPTAEIGRPVDDSGPLAYSAGTTSLPVDPPPATRALHPLILAGLVLAAALLLAVGTFYLGRTTSTHQAASAPVTVVSTVLVTPTPPPAPAPQLTPEQRFLDNLQVNGLAFDDAANAIAGAHTGCAYLDAGHTRDEAVQQTMANSGLDATLAQAYVREMINAFCPQHQ